MKLDACTDDKIMTHIAIHSKVVDRHGKEIKNMRSWDTENHEGEQFMVDKGNMMKIDPTTGNPAMRTVHDPQAQLVIEGTEKLRYFVEHNAPELLPYFKLLRAA